MAAGDVAATRRIAVASLWLSAVGVVLAAGQFATSLMALNQRPPVPSVAAPAPDAPRYFPESSDESVGVWWIGADLSGAELSGMDLRNADLSYVNLSDVALSGASLRNADLLGVDLSVKYLSDADLVGARRNTVLAILRAAENA
jgi:hypothetical protein